jgi:PKD repeat protein
MIYIINILNMKTICLSILLLFTGIAFSQCSITASFTYKDSSGYLIFKNTSANYDYIQWNVSGYGSSNAESFSFFKPLSGPVSVFLYVRDSSYSNCWDTSFLSFVNFGTCVTKADFDYNTISKNVNFSQYSVCNRMKQEWSYGDGTVSNSFQATHNYPAAGTYTVMMFVYDSLINNCRDTAILQVLIKDCYTTAKFDAKVDSFGAWHFVNLSTLADVYEWDFGDSTSRSFLSNPYHSYAFNGNHTVTLIARDTTYNQCADTFSLTIPQDICSIIARFSYSRSGKTISMNNLSINANQWEWDFGDGFTSNDENPIHTFTKAGGYNVYLKVYDSTKSNCFSLKGTYIVIDTCAVSAFFSYSDSLSTVSFANYSSYANKYLWVFGDGDSSTLKNPIHTYDSFKNYSVTLYAFDTNYNNCVSSKVVVFTLNDCKAYFEIVPDTSQQYSGLLIDKSTARNSANYFWDFGDGDSSTSKTPTHTYNGNGPYYISLCIVDSACSTCYVKRIQFDTLGNLNMVQRPFSFKVIREGSVNNSIDLSHFSNIKLGPNPVSDYLNIKLTINLLFDVQIFNVNGVMIFEQKSAQNEAKIEFSEYNSGVYMVKIQTEGGGVKVFKVIKE